MKKTTLLMLFFLSAGMVFSQETAVRYLSGTGSDNTKTWQFYCTDGMNSGKWTTIEVPSNWEQQGFGNYNYGSDYYRPDEETIYDEKGLYKYRFQVPEAWADKNVFLVFEGSMTDTKVKINGKQAGPVHQGGYYRFEYPVSDLLKFGEENLLEAEVSKNSADSTVTLAERRGDYWVFGGIFRPVYLEAYPAEFIKRMAIDAKANGKFMVEAYTRHLKKATTISGQIFDSEGQKVGDAFSVDVENGQEKAVLNTRISTPKTWSPEFPHLYHVQLSLKNGDEVLHTVKERFGFRTVTLKKGRGIYVNGQKIKFKGVNRHGFRPSTARTLSKSISITDVKRIKAMNMNAVRMSHWPPDSHFLDVCDSLGLFVLNELAGWHKPPYNTEVGEKLVREMVTRDVNHPSIVIWDNANETGWNPELDDDFHRYDPQKRPVIHPWAIYKGTDTQHYMDYNYGVHSLFHGRNIFFPTEILHGLYDGGHGAGMNDMWKSMWQHPLSAGMFLWVLYDEGVERRDLNDSVDTHGSNAPDGIMGPYGEKEGSYYTIKEIWAPVHFNQKQLSAHFTGKLPVENRYFYTNLNQCTFDWELVTYPGPQAKSQEAFKRRSGKAKPLSLAPRQSDSLDLNLPENWQDYDVLRVTGTGPHGREIYTWTWPIRHPRQIKDRIVSDTTGKTRFSEDEEYIYLSAAGTKARFSKENGLLQGITRGEIAVPLRNGPRLTKADVEFAGFEHREENGNQVLEVNYTGDDQYHVTWTMMGNGWLKLQYGYINKGTFDYLGVTFDFPEDQVEGMQWLGKGPYRVWKNRMKGTEFNVWQKGYNNTITGETWEYPEFKGYHANLYWARIATEKAPFSVVAATHDLFLHMLTPTPPRGAYNDNTAPPFPDGNLSFLHGISAMGTKFKKPEELGPSGQKNIHEPRDETGTLRGTLYFRFE